MISQFDEYFTQCPIVAILRGITPKNCIEVTNILYDAGVRIIEVPLNSPEPFESIRLLKSYWNDRAIIGAGTVLSVEDVEQLHDLKADIIVAPNLNISVGHVAKKYGMIWLPGVLTPTEGFLALENGADGLKLFPAESITPQIIKAWQSVFPKNTKLIPVGGIKVSNIKDYLDIGVSGFGVGGTIFKPNYSLAEIKTNIEELIQVIK
ncbi:2-dehydro-3-deoxy-6-phosphogalactonate aldolase [Gallibacterium sp. AGMB14963]|uniref:2-dehydro-3-deoxy-6-phosphogalactonate aldolase n=1 Tax=Gallibacterium faecale TaxID=3019086 RepID=UPI0022F1A318|nr:2-dehydro-3-deoxy-6-phosphogalactonate aldolase [Gallibacterium sp. AGMB14963]MDA3979398.1 2-dehydro-3-deoxy-6-phosphogalactonate aldolase [Gallibacterium sp. AGMB14963]